MSSESNLRILH